MLPRIIIILLGFLFLYGCSDAETFHALPNLEDNLPSPIFNAEIGDINILASGTFNIETGSLDLNTRDISSYLNVTPIVGSNFSYYINGVIPPNILDITLSISNTSGLTVHDVCIVFDELYGKTVVNPDSYIDIFQPYDINPFIAFRKEDPFRTFPPISDAEQLLLKYPGGSPLVDFFIIAHLGGNTGGVYSIEDWVVDGQLTPDGGNATISVSIYDHQFDISTVLADTTVLTGGITNFIQAGYPNPWQATISNTEHAPGGTYTIIVMSSSPAAPSYQTYNFFEILVADMSETVFGDDIFIFNPGGANHWAGTNGRHNMIADGDNFYFAFNSFYVSPLYWAKGDIHFTKSTDGGVTWSEQERITNEPTYGDILNYPSLAKKGSTLYIAHERIKNPSDYYFDILKSDDDGDTWSVWYESTSGKHTPSICVDPYSAEEKVFVAYSDSEESIWVATKDSVYPWRYNRISDTLVTGKEVVSPDIAFNPVTQKVMVCWSDAASVTSGSRVKFDSSIDGINWDFDIVVSDSWISGHFEKNPILAVNPVSGVPGILFDYDKTTTGIELYFCKANDEFATSFNPHVQVTGPKEYLFSSSLDCEESGRWLAAWYSAPDMFTNQDCYFKESIDGGSIWINEQIINDPIRPNGYQPVLASNGSDVCVGWLDQRDGNDQVWVDHGTH